MDNRLKISDQAVRTARKMAVTVFNRYDIRPPRCDRLLRLITSLSLQDLLAEGAVAWAKNPTCKERRGRPPATPLRREMLAFIDGRTVLVPATVDSSSVGLTLSEDEIERTFQRIEDLLDEFSLPEGERAALYTALPCLGLAALGDRLLWRKPPPFPEV